MMTLRILLKDLRRLRWELALFVATVAGVAIQISHPWVWYWLRRNDLLFVALFVLWGVFVERVVHGESLVGDREFWTTRPYRWPNLLASKALGAVVGLNVPFTLAQLYVLHLTGFTMNAELIVSLLCFQGLYVVMFTLPSAAVAAVTANLTQWIGTLIGMLLAVLVVCSLPVWNLPVTLEGMQNLGLKVSLVWVGVMLVALLLMQYAWRHTLTGRVVLGASLAAALLTVALASSGGSRWLSYPAWSEAAPFVIGPQVGKEYAITTDVMGEMKVTIPFTATPAAPGRFVQIEGIRYTLDGDKGRHWQSGWTRENIQIPGEATNSKLEAIIPAAASEGWIGQRARLKVELAIAEYQIGAPYRVDTAAERFQLTPTSACRWRGRNGNLNSLPADALWLECQAAYRMPEVLLTEYQPDKAKCEAAQAKNVKMRCGAVKRVEWNGSNALLVDTDPTLLHMLSLRGSRLEFEDEEHTPPTMPLERGVPLTVRVGKLARRGMVTQDLGTIAIPEPKPQKGIELSTEDAE